MGKCNKIATRNLDKHDLEPHSQTKCHTVIAFEVESAVLFGMINYVKLKSHLKLSFEMCIYCHLLFPKCAYFRIIKYCKSPWYPQIISVYCELTNYKFESNTIAQN